jgi:ACS family hexuronate transporter-like MFS transporter
MKRPEVRWWVCGMLFLATGISYIDRQTVSIVAPLIAKEFHLNNEQIGRILAAFLFAYTFGQLIAGRFLDWAGARIGLSISIGVWSLANALTATVSRFFGFVFYRFLLGAGESGNFPAGVKVIGEWFPAEERAIAGGVMNSGASVGAIAAGPLAGTIAQYWGWRAAFLITGSLGFVWLVPWLFIYRAPVTYQPTSIKQSNRLSWTKLLRFRQVWALVIARFLEEQVLWVGIFWMPKYIADVRGLSVLQTGWLVSLPYLALAIGYLSGGWISSRLVRRGWRPHFAKLTVMFCAAALMTCSIPAALAGSIGAFTALISMSLLGHGAWFTNMFAMPADIAPPEWVASVYGIAAMGGGLGGIVFTEMTGVIVDRLHSYSPVFIASGLMPLIATVVLVILGGRMGPLEAPRSLDA